MMNKLAIAIVLALMVGNVYARNDGGDNGAGCVNNCGNGGGGGGGSYEPPVVTTPVHNGGSAVGVGVGVAGASASSSAGASNTSINSSSTTVNSGSTVDYSDYVPNAYAPPLATGHCMGSASAGGSGPGFGFSLGKTYIDENCNARYDAILLRDLGFMDESVLRLCQQPRMAEALGDKCPAEYHASETEAEAGRWWIE
jgi:hypothetical protein